MTALTEFIFPAPASRSVGSIVRWWESRRLAYNAIVGTTGAFTLVVGHLIALLPPNPPFEVVPWQIVVVYGVMANVCYTFGEVAESVLHRLFRGGLLPAGPTLWRMGLTFSVGLTLFPVLMVCFFWGLRIVSAVF